MSLEGSCPLGDGSAGSERCPETQEITVTIRSIIFASATALTFAGTAQADALRPIEARSIDLGAVSGLTYYTVEQDGYRVVAVLGQGPVATPVRVEALLAPGQSVLLSTPREAGADPVALEISRVGDQLRVQAPEGSREMAETDRPYGQTQALLDPANGN